MRWFSSDERSKRPGRQPRAGNRPSGGGPRALVGALLIAGALSVIGCVHMPLGDAFLVVDESPGQLKAITADGAKVWVRDFPQDGGDLKFWSAALKLDFVQRRGYVLRDEAPITDGSAHAGVAYLFETQVQGRPVRYWIAVFLIEGVLSDTVRVVEYIADKDVFDAHYGAVKRAVTQLS